MDNSDGLNGMLILMHFDKVRGIIILDKTIPFGIKAVISQRRKRYSWD